MGLRTYKKKRDFNRTTEPSGRGAARNGSRPTFVIQKHAARRLHYDFRLELNGVLKSWAVPKGMPTRQGDKRLAIQVEDHPLEYAHFEGSIPEGNYGAGSVMVWDVGTYEAQEDDSKAALNRGKLIVRLHGKKLKGQWTLVRMRRTADGNENAWLLIKTGGNHRPVSVRADETSAQSGRTMKQIAGDGHRTKASAGSRPAALPRAATMSAKPLAGSQKLTRSAPGFIKPMKALLVDALPRGDGWLFEVKFDGIRAIGVKNGRDVRLYSRLPRELTTDHPEIVRALRALPARQIVADGEIVALDEEGRSSFQLLQNFRSSGSPARPPLLFYIFDLLNLNGRDLTALPLIQRRGALENLLKEAKEPLRFSPAFDADALQIWKQVKRLGLEGVVAKRRDSKYEAGRRSGSWLKIKRQSEQEFVIGGYTSPQGTRKNFGAILVGYYDDGQLMFASKVGTGFNVASLKSLYHLFQQYRVTDCPFSNLPTKRAGHAGQGITNAQMKRCCWLAPELVCHVRFHEWTNAGNLRQPVFLGLRDDKEPRQVVREKARGR